MAFHSSRTVSDARFEAINFLTPVNRQHTYSLVAGIYPYAVQPAGEIGMQGELIYKFKKDSKLGGKYGTLMTLHYARIHDINREKTGDQLGYQSSFFDFGRLFYSDFFTGSFSQGVFYREFFTGTFEQCIFTVTFLQGHFYRDVFV